LPAADRPLEVSVDFHGSQPPLAPDINEKEPDRRHGQALRTCTEVQTLFYPPSHRLSNPLPDGVDRLLSKGLPWPCLYAYASKMPSSVPCTKPGWRRLTS